MRSISTADVVGNFSSRFTSCTINMTLMSSHSCCVTQMSTPVASVKAIIQSASHSNMKTSPTLTVVTAISAHDCSRWTDCSRVWKIFLREIILFKNMFLNLKSYESFQKVRTIFAKHGVKRDPRPGYTVDQWTYMRERDPRPRYTVDQSTHIREQDPRPG